MATRSTTKTRGGKRPPKSPPNGGDGLRDRPASLADEARRRYLTYALSVITSRALPDARDGLKPVQRRILYGMWNDLNLSHDAKYKKCAQVVGAIMGPYHPHGDSAIYDALVRMAQDFSLRYPLVDGHGNFGSLDGDSAAAYRYTECRLQRISEELLGELDKDTVDFRPNYDGTRKEPVVLPARLPQLLMNGVTGIAVGMATNIPPHHLGELIDACVALLETPSLTTKDLLAHVKGPDFPTGGRVLNDKAELRQIYETGHGAIRMRGEYKLEPLGRSGQQIVITSIPYAVNKANLVGRIGDLVRERKVPLIVDVRDESTTDVRIVLELKKEADPDLVMAYLFKQTPLQTNFNVNMTVLVPSAENPEVSQPQRLGLKELLAEFLAFRVETVRRRITHELEKLRARLHVLDGFEKVYDALDEMIRIIRRSEGKQDAAGKLMKRFSLDAVQVDAILEMKLYKLARLEILVIQNEAKEKRAAAKKLESILKSEKRLRDTVKDELLGVSSTYADKRRTRIGGTGIKTVEVTADAFLIDEDAHIILTRDGWVKRVREVKDPTTTRLREGDEVMAVLAGSLKSHVVFFTNLGSAYVTRFNEVQSSTGYGDPIQKLFRFSDGERVVGACSLDPRLERPELMLAVSESGYALRFPLDAHTELSTRAGRRFARPASGDQIVGVRPAGDRDLVTVLTRRTAALVAKVEEINVLSGPGRGVSLIKPGEGDIVLAFMVSAPRQKDAELHFETVKGRKLVLTPGKYGVTGRGGKGHEMSKRDEVRSIVHDLIYVPLPQ